MENKIITQEVLTALESCPEGEGWFVLVWKSGEIATIIGGGYGGEQDGKDPLLILKRGDFGDMEGWEGNADLWDAIEEDIVEAGGEYSRRQKK